MEVILVQPTRQAGQPFSSFRKPKEYLMDPTQKVTIVQGSGENGDKTEEFMLQYRVGVRTQPKLCQKLQAE